MKIIAHRGASADAPENSIESILLADKMSSDYIEIDVQLTRDNQVVLMHDKTVDRTTNLSGNTNTFSLEELQKVKAPSLSDILSLKLKANLIIEVKGNNTLIVKKIIDTVKSSNFSNKIIYKSFNRDLLKEFKKQDPTRERIFVFVASFWNITIDTFLRLASAEKLIDVEYYQAHYSFPNESLIKRLHKKNKKVILWGVNSKKKYLKAKKLKVHAIETDHPDLDFK